MISKRLTRRAARDARIEARHQERLHRLALRDHKERQERGQEIGLQAETDRPREEPAALLAEGKEKHNGDAFVAERAEFEEWLQSEYMLDDEWDERRSCYKHFACHLAWRAWKAARSAALSQSTSTSVPQSDRVPSCQ